LVNLEKIVPSLIIHCYERNGKMCDIVCTLGIEESELRNVHVFAEEIYQCKMY
jgi:hypothetical protein